MVEKRRKSFVKRMVIALVLGVIVGAVVALLKPSMSEGVWNVLNTIFFQDISVSEGRSAIGLFYIIQTVFTNALKLAIVPMVLFSIIMSVCGMNDMRKLGRIAAKTILMCFVCWSAYQWDRCPKNTWTIDWGKSFKIVIFSKGPGKIDVVCLVLSKDRRRLLYGGSIPWQSYRQPI